MTAPKRIAVQGYVTQYKFIAGRSLREIEKLLGFHAGRLAQGATFAALDRLPSFGDFTTAGYSQVAAHRHRTPEGLDMDRIKRMAMSAWATTGPDRLLKVVPMMGHSTAMDDDLQYPPGQGVAQWKLTAPVPATVVAVLNHANDVFRLPTIR